MRQAIDDEDQAPRPMKYVVGIADGKVGIQFEEAVNEIFMTPSQARRLSVLLARKAMQARGMVGRRKKARKRRRKR